jgi:hypothetical protein
MGFKFVVFILGLATVLAQLNPLTPTQNILNGTGWSTDLQAIASTNCYANYPPTVTGTQQYAGMQESYTSDEIAYALGIHANLDIAFSMFQATAMFNYLGNMTQNSHMLTANYYYIIQVEYGETYDEGGVALLNKEGKAIYDDGKNPMFRILCGDTLINGYTVGAAVFASVSLIFETEADMLAVSAGFSIGFGSYANVAAAVSYATSNAGVECQLQVTAMQFGGDTSDLGLILAANPGSCLSSNPEGCTPLINAIADYIGGTFAPQINNYGSLVPLGGVILGQNVADCGLDVGTTTLTPPVLAAQSWILSTWFSYQNWYNAMTPIVSSLMVLDPVFKQELDFYYANLQYNIDWISSGGTMSFPPYNCFGVNPLDCEQTVTEIQQTLADTNVTSQQLTTLFEAIKYTYTIECAFDFTLYPLGNWDYIYEDVSFAVSSQNFALQNGSFNAGPINMSISEADGSFDYEEFNTEAGAYQIMEVKYELTPDNEGESLSGSIAVYNTNGEYFNLCPGAATNATSVIGAINPYWSNFTEQQINVTMSRRTNLYTLDF